MSNFVKIQELTNQVVIIIANLLYKIEQDDTKTKVTENTLNKLYKFIALLTKLHKLQKDQPEEVNNKAMDENDQKIIAAFLENYKNHGK